MNEFDFKKQLAMSHGVEATGDIKEVLLGKIPGALKISKANDRDDRSGTDYWVEHVRGTPISIDTKVRSQDPLKLRRPKDDLALEIWSIVKGSHSRDSDLSAIGWTLDEKKRTDYVLWWFTPTSRWVLVPFTQLQAVFKKRLDDWYAIHQHDTQWTRRGREEWRSECVFVPREEIWSAIFEDFGGGPVRNHALRRHGDVREISPRPAFEPRGVVGYTRPEHAGPGAPIVIGVEPVFLQQLGARIGDEVSCAIGSERFVGVIVSNTNVRPNRDLPHNSTVRVWRASK